MFHAFIPRSAPALAAGLCCALLASGVSAGMLAGSASYRERMLLPPDAVFSAELLDVSLADAPADLLARGLVKPAGQTPFNFRIAYDDAAIREGRTYVVRASVHHQGRLLFTSDSQHRVLDGSSAPLVIPMIRVTGGDVAGEAPRSADAAAGAATTPEAAATQPDQPLRNTYWKLLALEGQPVGPADFQREPHIVFAQDEGRVHGSGGCNGFFGGFEQPADGRLKMNRMASTMMACMQGMALEHRFLRTLERVDGYRISAGTLTLLAADGSELARLEAVALR